MSMVETRVGTVTAIIAHRTGITEIEAEVNGRTRRAVAYEDLTGAVSIGDRVVLNTTAGALRLGSGGYDFVVINLNHPEMSLQGSGHIMKMRYTPWQCRVLSVEEEDSPYHDLIQNTDDLARTPVLVGTLHSMLGPLNACLAMRSLKVAYVMTDAASLPISWSRTVDQLKRDGMLLGTVTVGNAWGGDLEAVNVFSGLLAARAVFRPDVIIVTMGPGIVGTGTRWGFSGVEQGVILNAVASLAGAAVAVPRISFEDPRPRHQGLSHHTLTVLSRVCQVRTKVGMPVLDADQDHILRRQMEAHDLKNKHDIVYRDGSMVEEALAQAGLEVETMGRGIDQDRAYFLALGAAARLAMELAEAE
jgi:hypothetical protein